MRIVAAVLIGLVGLTPALAQRAPKPAKPALAKSAYAAMPEAERLAIQTDLVWTGDYNGMIGPDFGERAIAAVKAFQKRLGGKETGVLTPVEREKLAQAAKPKREHVGWFMVHDPVTGARLGLPAKFVPNQTSTASGSRWQSARGEVQIETFSVRGADNVLAAVFARQKKEPKTRKVEYQVLKPDFFVLSGLQGLKKFYVRAHPQGGEVRGFTILYDQAMDGLMDAVVVALSNAFVAFPTGALAGPPPKRKVDYGTGIVVSRTGHVLADRHVTDECQTITLAGLGPAERIAEDKAHDLALLKINGARGLSPASLAGGTALAGDVTLIGVADPERQNGGGEVSQVKVRVMAASGGVEPAPLPGFSGAAATDSAGTFLGMVGLKGDAPAAIIPADAVRSFLAAQKIGPAGDAAAVGKGSVVRVICVRK